MIHQITIQNLKCGGCAHTIKTEVGKIESVSNVNVDEATSVVSFNSSDDVVLAVAKRLDELGYPTDDDSNTLLKKAKSYVSCAVGRINKD